ncbi:YeeE/YedE thiosulfate transporter family protein [Uliginosibacterium paludis]|uniref:YeeE/YedE thiosulfate transporter family protein n=1 Tax=Uliginosibacterium paludis TaxID=1615952 RepID=A0ABV2CP88_9RHOO
MHLVNFTPWSALAGGALIGLAAALLALCCGRIAGISGIAGQLLTRGTPDRLWRIAFLGGLLAAPWLLRLVSDSGTTPHSAASPGMLLGAGLLVGLGTRMANGCTSGHGVCGLARFSLRSLVSVASFMAAGFLTVWLLRHVWGGA